MAVEVLRPQDPLRNRIHTHRSPFHRRQNFPDLTVNQRKHPNTTQKKVNPNTNVNTSPKPEKKKIKKSPRSPQGGGAAASAPVIGQVTILKRGESLSSILNTSRVENPNPSPSRSSNPNPNFHFNPKSQQSVNGFRKIEASDMYAGSGFVISPSPQSLPFPSFFGRKGSSDDASENLKRLLRL